MLRRVLEGDFRVFAGLMFSSGSELVRVPAFPVVALMVICSCYFSLKSVSVAGVFVESSFLIGKHRKLSRGNECRCLLRKVSCGVIRVFVSFLLKVRIASSRCLGFSPLGCERYCSMRAAVRASNLSRI